MARTLASAWVSISPTGFSQFGIQAKAGIKRVLAGASAVVPITASTVKAVAGIDDLKLRLDDLSRRVAAAKIGIDDKAAIAALARMDVRLDVLGAKVARPGITLEGEKRALADILAVDAALDALSKKTATPRVSGGGGGGVLSGLPLIGQLGPAGGTAAVAAGLTALPFIAQLAAGGIVTALGGGLAALGVAGALYAGKAAKGLAGVQVSTAQVSAAQDTLRASQLRLTAAQDRLNTLQGTGKATAAQLATAQASVASAQGSVASSQDRLNKLQGTAAQQANARGLAATYTAQLKVQKAFSKLSADAKVSLASIGTSFVPVMGSIASTADRVLKGMTPTFASAVRTISGPFQAFADGLLKAFDQPAVKQSIAAVATAFGAILKAVTPGLATDIGQVATGITKIAKAVTANPKAFADFIGFLAATVGGVLTAIAALTRFASYIEAHFIPVFDGARHEISHVWADIASNTNDAWKKIWDNTIGQAIRNVHDLETWYNDLRHFVAVVLDGIRSDSVSIWNSTWSNTVSRAVNGISAVVSWFRGLPGRVRSALGAAGSLLAGWGRGVIDGLLSGMESVVGSVWTFIKGIPGKILHFLGIKSPPQWAIDAGQHIMNGIGIGMGQAQAAAAKAAAALKNSISASIPLGSGALTGLAGGTNEAVMQSVAAAHGWTGAQWQAMYNVEMREAGFDLRATNPSSGAYGEAQFINGPSEYYTYGGNPNTAIGQAVAMANYISSRYGNPEAAWAHEQAFNWYGRGTGSAARGLAIVGEHGPELVRFGGGERVTPMGWHGPGRAGGSDGSAQPVHVTLEFKPSGGGSLDAAFLRWIRETVRVQGGGNVQNALSNRHEIKGW